MTQLKSKCTGQAALDIETSMKVASDRGERFYLLVDIEGDGVMPYAPESRMMMAVETRLLAVRSPNLM